MVQCNNLEAQSRASCSTFFAPREFRMASPTDTLAAWQKAALDATIACTQATLASAEQQIKQSLVIPAAFSPRESGEGIQKAEFAAGSPLSRG